MAAEIMYGLNSYLMFRIGSERFAVNIGNVTNILEMAEITKVPNSQRHFKGIINHFGDVLPVFDGRIKFGFPATEIISQPCILVLVLEVDGQATTAGIVVDSVEKVVIVETSQIQTAGAIEKGFNMVCIHGIVPVEDEFMIILDVDQLFSKGEIKLMNAVE